tara:strand:+ start:1446 stop:2102 length:657 start_codon:yes stop_codon:yes gene_type:complete
MSKKNKKKCSLQDLSKHELTNDLTNVFLTPLHNKRKPKPKVYLGDEEVDPSHISIAKMSKNNHDNHEMPIHSITIPSDEERYQNMVNEGLIRNELFNLGIPSHKPAKIRRRKALNPENVDPVVYGIDYSKYINNDDNNELMNMLQDIDNDNAMFNSFDNERPLDNNLNTEELLSLLKTDSENDPILFITKGGKLRKKKRSSRKTKKKKSRKGKKSRKH